jgi:uncharacterized protein (TIGR03118 family)
MALHHLTSRPSRAVTTAPWEPLEPRRLLSGSTVPAFARTDLVSDGAVPAAHIDANLVNAWGLAFNKFGVVWVGDNGTGVSTVYDTAGNLGSPVVAIPPPAGGAENAAVTGVAFNAAGKAFNVTANGQTSPAEYVFVSEDGTISGWNPADGTSAVNAVDNSAAGAVYKGVAIMGKGKKALLYAANFHAGTVEVYNANFQPVTTAGFADPNIPAGFAPFNVQAVGKSLYVTYAQQDAAAHDDVAGAGNGFVDVFNTKGRLVRRLASNGPLNSPWAVVAGQGKFKKDVLVGNFGDGTINVFSAKGKSLGPATDASGQPIVVDGLWGLAYGTGHDENKLFFAAGPNDEANGLLGVLTPTKLASSVSPGNVGAGTGGGTTGSTPGY